MIHGITAFVCSMHARSPVMRTTGIPARPRTAAFSIASLHARPFTFEPPIALELDFNWTHNADYADMIPGFERIGPRSVRFVHDDYRVVFKAYIAAFRLAAVANEPV